MLGIHPKTLHSWLKEANLPLALSPTDARIKCLEEQHLQEVARRHDRSLPELPCALVSSEEQVTSLPATTPCEPDLMQKLSCLETKVATDAGNSSPDSPWHCLPSGNAPLSVA